MEIYSLGSKTCDILVSLTVLFFKPEVIFTFKVLPKVYHICFHTSETYILSRPTNLSRSCCILISINK